MLTTARELDVARPLSVDRWWPIYAAVALDPVCHTDPHVRWRVHRLIGPSAIPRDSAASGWPRISTASGAMRTRPSLG